jgi:hypothetical protein
VTFFVQGLPQEGNDNPASCGAAKFRSSNLHVPVPLQEGGVSHNRAEAGHRGGQRCRVTPPLKHALMLLLLLLLLLLVLPPLPLLLLLRCCCRPRPRGLLRWR